MRAPTPAAAFGAEAFARAAALPIVQLSIGLAAPNHGLLAAQGKEPIMRLEITIGPPLLTVNQGHTVLACEPDGQIHDGTDKGLFFFDTRVMSVYNLAANGVPFRLLNAGSVYYYASRSTLTNDEVVTEDGTIPPGTLSVTLCRSLDTGLHEDIDIANYGPAKVRFNLEIVIRSDFADLFEVKAGRIVRRGRVVTDWDDASGMLRTAYANAGFHREIVVRASRSDSRCSYANGRLTFEVEIERGRSWHSCLEYSLVDGERRFELPKDCFGQGEATRLGQDLAAWREAVMKLTTSNEEFYRFYSQSVDDLASLRLPIEGTDHLRFVPAAGVPWFVALFGRDSLIAAMQTSLVYPAFARGALEVLGELQATERDDYRDAEPGKILHELRFGELAFLKKIPHTPYYGTADATPLYIVTLHLAWRSTGDRGLLERHLATAERCLAWIDEFGDRDGDGFQEYQTRSSAGYENQGLEGRRRRGDGRRRRPCARTQGALRAARLCLRRLAADGGDLRSSRLRREGQPIAGQGGEVAAALRRGLLERRGRLLRLLPGRREEEDPDGRVEPRPSALERHSAQGEGGARGRAAAAPGHVVGMGHPHAVVRSPVVQPAFYQNGSVWPHDNGLIAIGFKRYGFHAEAARIARDISGACSYFMLHQMPELFAGLARGDTSFPVQYPGANVPQAWAAGSVFALLQAIIGFQPHGEEGVLYLDPWPPPWLPDLTLRDLRVGDQTFDLRIEGVNGDAQVECCAAIPGGSGAVRSHSAASCCRGRRAGRCRRGQRLRLQHSGCERSVRDHRAAVPLAFAPSILNGLISELAVMGAIRRDARRGRAAIPKFGARRIAERPSAHRLFQLDDRHAQRHRHDDVLFHTRRLGLDRRIVHHRHHGVAVHHMTAGEGACADAAPPPPPFVARGAMRRGGAARGVPDDPVDAGDELLARPASPNR